MFQLKAAAYFNRFLEHIGHPQRIFSLDDGSFFLEKETCVFICADKARFPETLRLLNHGNDLEIKAEMPSLSSPAKEKVLRNLCENCISSNQMGNYVILDDCSDRLVAYYEKYHQEAIFPATQMLIVQAMSLKAHYLKRLGYRAEERASHEFIIKHFGQCPALPVSIGKAWSGLGSSFLLDAKSAWNDAPTARNLLRQARTTLETACVKRPDSGAALGNLAYALWLSGEAENAELTLRRAFSSPIESGKWLHEAMRSDIATHPIPPDAGFEALLNRVWRESGAPA